MESGGRRGTPQTGVPGEQLKSLSRPAAAGWGKRELRERRTQLRKRAASPHQQKKKALAAERQHGKRGQKKKEAAQGSQTCNEKYTWQNTSQEQAPGKKSGPLTAQGGATSVQVPARPLATKSRETGGNRSRSAMSERATVKPQTGVQTYERGGKRKRDGSKKEMNNGSSPDLGLSMGRRGKSRREPSGDRQVREKPGSAGGE